MKGIVLAGGTGSRLYPLTKVTNKHLLPVGKKPMVFYPIEALVNFGIKDIIIVCGTDHIGDMIGCLGSGREFGCQFTYKVQDEAGGIAQALGLCESCCEGHDVLVILGDNIFTKQIPFSKNSYAEIAVRFSKNPERFGVVVFDENGKVEKIVEKPKEYIGNMIVTGIYKYPKSVFEIVKTLKPSNRGELEITDVNNAYIQKGELKYAELKGEWTDAGTFESLNIANKLVEGNK
ncbi:MAG: sugar phosphate nucleotidyltransferase [Elusimicrobiota bacterium]